MALQRDSCFQIEVLVIFIKDNKISLSKILLCSKLG